MTNIEIYKNLKDIGGIYGYMYGRHISDRPIDQDIIFISQKDLTIGKYADCFVYIWGWPGPDGNIYKFQDYGKTWSFNKNDLYSNN